MKQTIPEKIPNWIDGRPVEAQSKDWFDDICPADGSVICRVSRSSSADIAKAVEAARRGFESWSQVPAVKRGSVLYGVADSLYRHKDDIAETVARETGKSFREALGETEGAVALGRFFAGEGQRLYGKTATSGEENRFVSIIRQPIGIAGLIVAANTPIANVAWKMFPALICGNSVVMKSAEDTPATAWLTARIASQAGLPAGGFTVVHGYGPEAGAPLVGNDDIGVISFTGSASVGREIAVEAGKRLARVSLELGGKNALVICDDADLDNALKWALSSSFSNAGQRCAASSRIIVFDSIYETFRKRFVEAASRLRIGPGDDDFLGPVINEKQLHNMIAAVEKAGREGASILCGGTRLEGEKYAEGFYMAPTIVENSKPESEFSRDELFGPVTALYRARDYQEALTLVNNAPYGLTADIHTRNLNRAIDFTQKAETGIVSVNGGTHGSEPHLPFGGRKMSGNGTREPGTEALDVYSELKNVYININPSDLQVKS